MNVPLIQSRYEVSRLSIVEFQCPIPWNKSDFQYLYKLNKEFAERMLPDSTLILGRVYVDDRSAMDEDWTLGEVRRSSLDMHEVPFLSNQEVALFISKPELVQQSIDLRYAQSVISLLLMDHYHDPAEGNAFYCSRIGINKLELLETLAERCNSLCFFMDDGANFIEVTAKDSHRYELGYRETLENSLFSITTVVGVGRPLWLD